MIQPFTFRMDIKILRPTHHALQQIQQKMKIGINYYYCKINICQMGREGYFIRTDLYIRTNSAVVFMTLVQTLPSPS